MCRFANIHVIININIFCRRNDILEKTAKEIRSATSAEVSLQFDKAFDNTEMNESKQITNFFNYY